MGCCPSPEGMPPGIRIAAYLLSSVVLMLWMINPILGAVSSLVLVVLYLRGQFILAKMDSVFTRCEVALRLSRSARVPGRLYCPGCGLRLQSSLLPGPTPHYACPSCAGAWCGYEELSGTRSLRAVPWNADSSEKRTSPLPCPKCARPMEQGGWVGAPITAHRCPTCSGTWVPRLDWAWLELGGVRRD